jgi:hypothetical protein
MIKLLQWLFLIFLAWSLILAILLGSADARADFSRDTVWLARCMVSEADTEAVLDHLAIAAVISKRSKKLGISITSMVRRYCKGLGPRDRKSPRIRWVSALDVSVRAPRSWTSDNGTWERYRERWFNVLVVADLALQGDAYDPCGGRAEHWGGKMDTPDITLIRIDCGPTKNIFYAYRNRQKK